MLEKFDPDARGAIVHARSEAVRLGSDRIGCEHLLLGLLDADSGAAAGALRAAGLQARDLRAQLAGGTDRQDDPLDADALASLGIDLDAVRRATAAAFGHGALDRVSAPRRDRLRVTGGLRMTRDAKNSLALALRAAASQDDRHISAGHVLMGVLDQEDNAALTALRSAGIDPGVLRADVVRRMTAAA
jgi:ATP-dependent Clp protease ATP-binding subunit ClpA